eukprot:TRINITY_DN1670_c1_g1_i1.p1 TRINITY_DN1670_c1_g1~~TRINITY_DN1670_c1_g1_i1.p1  ORF type:complete len:1432 (-),score=506.63 TRINITY_DN1670_c1_g1_i1:85-4380(-)
MWYKVPAGTAGRVIASTCSKYTTFDTQMTLYAGSCDRLQCVTGNDDVAKCGKRSLIRFNANPNVQYYILVHGYKQQAGQFKLWWAGPKTQPARPTNPGCLAASTMSLPFVDRSKTNNAPIPRRGVLAKCGGPVHSGPAKWYKLPAGSEGVFTASTCSRITNFDTQITVYSTENSCNGAFTCVAGNDDQTDKKCGPRSTISFKAEKNKEYFVLVHGYRTQVGNYELKVTKQGGGVGPGTLTGGCAKARALPIDAEVSGSTTGAPTPRTGLLAKCGGPAHTGPAVWFRVPAGYTGRLDLSTCDPVTNFDTQMTVYEGPSCGGPFKCITGNDDQEDKKCGPRSTLSFTAEATKQYWVLVHGYKLETGNFKLRVSKYTPPVKPKDGCDLATAVARLPFNNQGTTDGALTPKAGQLAKCGGPVHSGPARWYKLPSGTEGQYRISTCHAETKFDSQLTVYTSENGCNGPFTCVNGNDDESKRCGRRAGLVVDLSSVKQYYVLVHGYNSEKGPFRLTIDKYTPPPKPKTGCDNAKPLSIPSQFMDSTKGLTKPTQLPKCMKMAHTGPTRWFKLPAGSEGEYEVSTCDQKTTFDTQVTVYTSEGCDKTFTCVAGNDDQTDKRCGRQSTVSFTAAANKQYWVAVHGYNTEAGAFHFSIIKKALPVATTINFLPVKNSKEHLATYRNNEGQPQTDYLVVRRAQTAVIAINTAGAIRNMQLILAEGAKPSDGVYVINIPVKGSRTGLKASDWWTVKNPGSGTSHVWTINIPPEAPIGLYNLRLQYEGTHFQPDRKVAILFNPYKSSDQVYMGDSRWRAEYVENEVGGVWKGGKNGKKFWVPWAFDQFNMANLLVAIRLLNKLSLKQRADPVMVTRWLSGRLNSAAFNDGLLWGRWKGSFDDGATPGSWEDTTDIYETYSEAGNKPVKYGQCWVFSAIFNTAARALGIPARSVTNYSSGHETRRTDKGVKDNEKGDYNQHLDKFWTKEGKKYKKTKGDSIWNFHVWNDLWMKRPDIAGNRGDGWQASDATPQEESQQGPDQAPFTEDNFCGPSSLKQMQAGEADSRYDADFILGETNGRSQDWVRDAEGQEYRKSGRARESGSVVMTKLPDYRCSGARRGRAGAYKSMCGQDITNEYKSNLWTADLLLSEGEVDEGDKSTGPVTFTPRDPVKQVMVGQPFEVSFDAELIQGDAAEVSLNIDAYAIEYNGDQLGVLKSVSQVFTLSTDSENTLKNTITLQFNSEDYKTGRLGKIMGKTLNIEFVYTGIVKDAKESYLHDSRYELLAPPVSVQCVDTVTAPSPAACIVKFTNPLPVPMTNVHMHLHVSSQAVDNEFKNKRVHTIGSNQEGVFKDISLATSTPGQHMVIATISSDQLNDLSGNDDVIVKKDPSEPEVKDSAENNETDETIAKPDLLLSQDEVSELEIAGSPQFITSHTGKPGRTVF